jgi:hypothetical protein
MTSQRPTQENLALRLMFDYEGRKVNLRSAQPVTMRVPASDRTDEYEKQSGTWIEVRDTRDRVLYRKLLHDPLQTSLEVPSGDPVRTFTRVVAPEARGAFSVVIPELAEAAMLVLWASPRDQPARPAEIVGQFPLTQHRKADPR